MSPLEPVEALLDVAPYSLDAAAKNSFFLPRLQQLTAHHYEHCPPYRNMVDRLFGGGAACEFTSLQQAPFLPVSLFKTRELKSVETPAVTKVLTSSGTTGQQVSRIFLDRETSQLQAAVMVKIMQQVLGKQRLPMIVIDHPNVIKDRTSFSARGAGILGMAQFGRQPFYALRDDMSLDIEGLQEYLARFAGQPVFLFGFTFMVWQFLVKALEDAGHAIRLPHSTLIHSGGWKKLQDQAVGASEFRERLQRATGIERVVNFYGMVEQVGSIFVENARHQLQCPALADVIIRNPVTLLPVPDGETGVIQVLSLCPRSYPGHSLLTEDLGRILGNGVPEAGVFGRSFEVLGRIPKSEIRGCSDTFQPVPLPGANPAAAPSGASSPVAPPGSPAASVPVAA